MPAPREQIVKLVKQIMYFKHRAALLTAAKFQTVILAPQFHQLSHAQLVIQDTVNQETPVFKFVEIALKLQDKDVMMETPPMETAVAQLVSYSQAIIAIFLLLKVYVAYVVSL